MRKISSVLCAGVLLMPLGGLAPIVQPTQAAANANRCVVWRSPSAGFVRNICNKKIDIRWQDNNNCVRGDCTITVQPRDTYTAGVSSTGRIKFVACYNPDYASSNFSCKTSASSAKNSESKKSGFAAVNWENCMDLYYEPALKNCKRDENGLCKKADTASGMCDKLYHAHGVSANP